MDTIGTSVFRGLIGGRVLIGWREAHNAHILQKLRARGGLWGINTPEDFASALRNGYTIPAGESAHLLQRLSPRARPHPRHAGLGAGNVDVEAEESKESMNNGRIGKQ